MCNNDVKFEKFLLLNARSIKTCTHNCNQLQAYHNSMLIEKPALFGIVETWLNNSITDNELVCDNYSTYRKDRNTRGGGILLNISNKFLSKRLINLECDTQNFNEIMICEMMYYNIKYVIVLCYRPPNASIEFNINFDKCLKNILDKGYKNICVMGDLNFPSINWDSVTSDEALASDFCEIIENYNLVQINVNPSRSINNNILDLVLVSNPELFTKVNTEGTLFNSDHYMVSFGATQKIKSDVGTHKNPDTFMILTEPTMMK